MNNIFEGAKLGDKFRTRDGDVAIYAGKQPNGEFLMIYISSQTNYPIVHQLTVNVYGQRYSGREYGIDIIGKWEVPINEEELAEEALLSAIEYNKSIDNTMTPDQEYWYQIGYQEGCKKEIKL